MNLTCSSALLISFGLVFDLVFTFFRRNIRKGTFSDRKHRTPVINKKIAIIRSTAGFTLSSINNRTAVVTSNEGFAWQFKEKKLVILIGKTRQKL